MKGADIFLAIAMLGVGLVIGVSVSELRPKQAALEKAGEYIQRQSEGLTRD